MTKMSNARLRRETSMVNISKFILKFQILMFGHAVEFDQSDRCHKIL